MAKAGGASLSKTRTTGSQQKVKIAEASKSITNANDVSGLMSTGERQFEVMKDVNLSTRDNFATSEETNHQSGGYQKT